MPLNPAEGQNTHAGGKSTNKNKEKKRHRKLEEKN